MRMLDRAIAAVSPMHALRRLQARAALDIFAGVHEVTRPTPSRKLARDGGNGNAIVEQDASTLRNFARRLERDHDLGRGVLNTLVQNTIGTGVDVEPAPRLPGGEIDQDLADQLNELYSNWWERPEVTWRHDAGGMQRLIARSAFRDGECLVQHLQGYITGLDHGSVVPYSVEMLEADMLPLGLRDPSRNIVQGIEVNAWGRPIAYHLHKGHPADLGSYLQAETKRVLAERISHLALTDRVGQLRGLSVFASVISRLEDIKDYEDSERVAARVAAALTAYIKKGQPTDFGGNGDASSALLMPGPANNYRNLKLVPGLIMDDLLPGEEIGLIDSKRPNPNAALFREGQLRAASRGVGTTFSSMSGNYNGTYSAQRQELIEQWAAYAVLTEWFIAQMARPMWRNFVQSAYLAGLVKLPKGWSDWRHMAAATFVRPAMPWINPLHEAEALAIQEDRGWISTPEIIRRGGGEPGNTLQQQRTWQRRVADAGIAPPVAANASTRPLLQRAPGDVAPDERLPNTPDEENQ